MVTESLYVLYCYSNQYAVELNQIPRQEPATANVEGVNIDLFFILNIQTYKYPGQQDDRRNRAAAVPPDCYDQCAQVWTPDLPNNTT